MKRNEESECRACQRPIRPHERTLADFPGTVACGARGLCMRCYRLARKGHFLVLQEPSHLTEYFARRRRLGVPAEGIHYRGEN